VALPSKSNKNNFFVSDFLQVCNGPIRTELYRSSDDAAASSESSCRVQSFAQVGGHQERAAPRRLKALARFPRQFFMWSRQRLSLRWGDSLRLLYPFKDGNSLVVAFRGLADGK